MHCLLLFCVTAVLWDYPQSSFSPWTVCYIVFRLSFTKSLLRRESSNKSVQWWDPSKASLVLLSHGGVCLMLSLMSINLSHAEEWLHGSAACSRINLTQTEISLWDGQPVKLWSLKKWIVSAITLCLQIRWPVLHFGQSWYLMDSCKIIYICPEGGF